jgi:hypothetical protein
MILILNNIFHIDPYLDDDDDDVYSKKITQRVSQNRILY